MLDFGWMGRIPPACQSTYDYAMQFHRRFSRLISPGETSVPEPDAVAHTEIIYVDGKAHTQHFGPGHIVDGSVRVIEVPAGETVVIRHVLRDAAR